jgi:hypothetical protein
MAEAIFATIIRSSDDPLTYAFGKNSHAGNGCRKPRRAASAKPSDLLSSPIW